MSTDPSQIQMLLQKVRQYPVHIQRQTLELYITHMLRNDSVKDIKRFCQNLLENEVNNPGFINSVSLNGAINHEINDGAKIKQRISKRLGVILSSYDNSETSEIDVYRKLEDIENMLNEIQVSLKNIVGNTKQSEKLTISEMLAKIQQKSELHDDAMLNAAQIMFDRIFESINPDSAEDYLDQSVLQVGPLKKSALLDASKEKYNQLMEYHQNGNFIRDYKVNYKRYLRNKSS